MKAIVRPYNQSTDDPFIYHSWFTSQRYGSERREAKQSGWFKKKCESIKAILSNAKTFIACLENDHDLILGYVVFDQGECKQMYVKKDYRNVGVESLLMSKGQSDGREDTKTDPKAA